MTTRVKVSTKGFEQYLEKLAAAGQDVDASIGRALQAGAQVAKEGMKRRAPKDTHNLEEHIKIDGPFKEGNFTFLAVGVIHKLEFTDAETARYANHQEYGSSSMPAQPYIRPTMAEDAGKIKRAMKDSLIKDGAI